YRASDQDKSGSGLGLAIVKEIIEAHGGEIDLASGSEGCTIRFMLPR
ncbi:MAG TPA: two-component sensor histidine kinase, partial [Firmicutes bacterium]|nr:two-component sensor histidine kinase [Bacillota bacterium]